MDKKQAMTFFVMGQANPTEDPKKAIDAVWDMQKELADASQLELLVRQLPKEEFVRRCCEMMEIDNATSLSYAGIVDLLENVHEQYFDRQSA